MREESARFVGQTIVHAEGHTRTVEVAQLQGQPVVSLRTWAKHFLIELPTMALRIHFTLFGSYRIDERKERAPRLALLSHN